MFVADTALSFRLATPRDARALTAHHNAAAADLTRRHGPGRWSSQTSERSVQSSIQTPPHLSRLLVARVGRALAGTLQLQTRKPWAIDATYFTTVPRPLYLIGMAVHPEHQGGGVGRALLARAVEEARAWPAQAIRLDAYDAAAGAGGFYARCGFEERGRVTYKGNPLVYYEMVME